MHQLIKQAFTLIELLVVIAIIGILSGLIVVSMGGMTTKATIAKAQVFSNSLRNSLMSNVVAEWKFDGPTADGSAATTNDILDTWGGTNNGILPASVPIVKTGSNCVSGSCLYFNGSLNGNYVSLGSNSSLSLGTGSGTVSFWVNFDNDIAPQYEGIIYCGGGGPTTAGYRLTRFSGSNRLYCWFGDGTSFSSAWISDQGSLSGNTWYNVAVVFDRSSSIRTYVNGVKQASNFPITSMPGNIVNASPYYIGGIASWTNIWLSGKLDDIRLYNAILPTSQIKEQYYAGLNSLLINSGITKEEYLSRINSIAQNE